MNKRKFLQLVKDFFYPEEALKLKEKGSLKFKKGGTLLEVKFPNGQVELFDLSTPYDMATIHKRRKSTYGQSLEPSREYFQDL